MFVVKWVQNGASHIHYFDEEGDAIDFCDELEYIGVFIFCMDEE